MDVYLGELSIIGKELYRITKNSLFLNIMEVRHNGQASNLVGLLIEDYKKIGWLIKNKIIWFIPNKMPTIGNDFLANKFEYCLHFAKHNDVVFNKDALRIPQTKEALKDKRKWKYNNKGRDIGNIWILPALHLPNPPHKTMFPLKLPLNAIKLLSDKFDTILDLFMGSGTTLIACEQLERNSIGIEISKEYCKLAYQRLQKEVNQIKFGREKSIIEKIGF
jgi:DNA modification methylase